MPRCRRKARGLTPASPWCRPSGASSRGRTYPALARWAITFRRSAARHTSRTLRALCGSTHLSDIARSAARHTFWTLRGSNYTAWNCAARFNFGSVFDDVRLFDTRLGFLVFVRRGYFPFRLMAGRRRRGLDGIRRPLLYPIWARISRASAAGSAASVMGLPTTM